MKTFPCFIVTLLLLTACETAKTGGPSSADLDRGINIRQGMNTSEVIALLGEPDYKKPGVQYNKLIMERWHYEIVVDTTSEYREIDTQTVVGLDQKVGTCGSE